MLKLEPGQTFRSMADFHLPAGTYQFIAGYGQGVMDGQSVSSNAVAFEIPAQKPH